MTRRHGHPGAAAKLALLLTACSTPAAGVQSPPERQTAPAGAAPPAGALLVPGGIDEPAQILAMPVKGGLVALDLRNGAVLWHRRDVGLPLGAGGGRVLAWGSNQQGRILFEVIDRRGAVVLRSDRVRFPPAGERRMVLHNVTPTSAEISWMTWQTMGLSGATPPDDPIAQPIRPGGGVVTAPPAPAGPAHRARPDDGWPPSGTARLDLVTGRLRLIDSGTSPSLFPAPAPPSPIPPSLAGAAVMAAPSRLPDGTIQLLRKERDAVVLYRWKDGVAPGIPIKIEREEPGRRLVLVGSSAAGILLWDCAGATATTDCRYRLYSTGGRLVGISPSHDMWTVGDIVLARSPDPRDRTRFRVERVNAVGRVLWRRSFEALPPPPPPPP